jgi:O-methyltransferase involved in polyketide biosynthesis
MEADLREELAMEDRMRVSVESLTPHQKTALVVLYHRAKESGKPDGKIKDSLAEEMVRRIDYDFSELEDDSGGQVGIAVRTRIFDRETAKFVERHPYGTIVNLGAGLDTRFFRVDNGKIRWFDIDLPEMIDLRRKLLPESERLSFIPMSVLDFQWMHMVPQKSPVLIIAEGLFIYFDESSVRALFQHIADYFADAEVLLDAISPMTLGAEVPGIDPALTPFKWGVYTLKELETWDPRLRLEEEWHSQELMPASHDLFANMLGLMLRPEAKVGRIRITAAR